MRHWDHQLCQIRSKAVKQPCLLHKMLSAALIWFRQLSSWARAQPTPGFQLLTYYASIDAKWPKDESVGGLSSRHISGDNLPKTPILGSWIMIVSLIVFPKSRQQINISQRLLARNVQLGKTHNTQTQKIGSEHLRIRSPESFPKRGKSQLNPMP